MIFLFPVLSVISCYPGPSVTFALGSVWERERHSRQAGRQLGRYANFRVQSRIGFFTILGSFLELFDQLHLSHSSRLPFLRLDWMDLEMLNSR